MEACEWLAVWILHLLGAGLSRSRGRQERVQNRRDDLNFEELSTLFQFVAYL